MRLLALLFLFSALGCGSGVALVSGDVMLDGTPVENGTISFEPADGVGPTMGGPITNGQYDVKGTPGKKNVLVRAFRLTGNKVPVNLPGSPVVLGDEILAFPPPGANHEKKETVLAAGENRFTVELTTPGGVAPPTKPTSPAMLGPGPPR
jgi:hypothetical protein